MNKYCSDCLGAAHDDAVIRTAVVAGISVKNAGNVASDARCARVVLSGARVPHTSLGDADLSRRVVVAQEETRNNGNQVFPINLLVFAFCCESQILTYC